MGSVLNKKLLILIITAGVDMMGTFLVAPILPFYAKAFGASAFAYTCIVAAFSLATLVSAPYWGRFSDRFGRRPALIIALGASAIAYIIFGFATSFWMLLLSRLVQGAGGGTVGVIQAYVADASAPKDRTRALGWLSAATNFGIVIGPALGSAAVAFGRLPLSPGAHPFMLGRSAPGVLAAAVCLVNMMFAWRYLDESHRPATGRPGTSDAAGRAWSVAWRVVSRFNDPAARLIWMYAVGIGAFYGVTSLMAYLLNMRFNVTQDSIWIFYTYVGVLSIVVRGALLGPVVDRFGEARLSRIGTVLMVIGLALIPLASSVAVFAVVVACLPLGSAFNFPCVTSMLSRVVPADERGVYMGTQQSLGGVARVVFPPLAGWLYGFNPGLPFWGSAVFVGATLFLGLHMDTYIRADASPIPPPPDAGLPTPAEPVQEVVGQ